MKKYLLSFAFAALALSAKADVLTSLPGPDDQGGMIMPMVMLSGNSLSVMFTPPSETPQLASLDHWSPGDTLQTTAAWYPALDPVGGAGDLFNNQYGFTFMGTIPTGEGLGIKLISSSSNLLQGWNYSKGLNRFDLAFSEIGDQVLWNGSMWHTYFTLPADAPAGTYSATFEVFIADQSFTAGTGFADYSAAARSAVPDSNYSAATVTYSWQVVPEPSTCLLLGFAGVLALGMNLRKRRLQQAASAQ